jgi:hypothetical protein
MNLCVWSGETGNARHTVLAGASLSLMMLLIALALFGPFIFTLFEAMRIEIETLAEKLDRQSCNHAALLAAWSLKPDYSGRTKETNSWPQ